MGIRAEWDLDESGHDVLRVTSDGDITMKELARFLDHGDLGMHHGTYAIIIRPGDYGMPLCPDGVELIKLKNPDIFASECIFR